jgi:hypothetical protein
LIEQLGVMLRRLFRAQKRLGDALEEENLAPEEFAHSIDETSRQGLGLSFETLAGMNPTQLESFCRSGGGTWASRMSLAAYLLQCDAHLAQRLGFDARAQTAAQEALYLYEQLHADPTVPAEYQIEEKRGEVIRFLQRER